MSSSMSFLMALTVNTKLFEISRKISIDEVLVHSHFSISRQLVYYIGSHTVVA
jgi:hypothetical protein